MIGQMRRCARETVNLSPNMVVSGNSIDFLCEYLLFGSVTRLMEFWLGDKYAASDVHLEGLL